MTLEERIAALEAQVSHLYDLLPVDRTPVSIPNLWVEWEPPCSVCGMKGAHNCTNEIYFAGTAS